MYRLHQYSGTTPECDGTTNVPIRLLADARPCIIRRVRLRYVSGACASYTPELYSQDIAGVPTTELTQEWAGASTLNNVAIDDSVTLYTQAGVTTDGAGNLWLRPGPNTGSDNVFEYKIDVEF